MERKAGNAESWSLVLILALICLLLAPAGAQASDPLLSGYAGPGSGEQVVLGGTTVGATKGGGGGGTSSGGAGATAATAEQSLRAKTTTSSSTSSSGLTRKPQRKKSSSSTSQQKTDDASTTSSGTATATTTTAALAGAPTIVAYPNRDGAVSGLPVSLGGILLIVLLVAALVLLGLGLRRMSGSDTARSDPQVSAS